MASALKELLDSIHPRRTLDQTARRADEALNTSPVKTARVTGWDEFRQCIIHFGQHVDTRILRLRTMPDMGPDFAWGHYSKVLCAAFGSNGEKAAFERARTGVEGGLNAVLRKFAEVQAREYAEHEIEGRIAQYWGGLSPDEKLRAMDEYLAEYGRLLPSELTEHGAGRLKMNFPQVLAEHPRMMQRLGQIGRR
jgi:hypothetical protein